MIDGVLLLEEESLLRRPLEMVLFSCVRIFSPVSEDEEKERVLRREALRVRFEEDEGEDEEEGIFNDPIAAIVAIVV